MSIIQSEGSALHIRTVASEVYDVTGAGDTAVAAMAVGLASGANISDVARLATSRPVSSSESTELPPRLLMKSSLA